MGSLPLEYLIRLSTIKKYAFKFLSENKDVTTDDSLILLIKKTLGTKPTLFACKYNKELNNSSS